MIEDGCICHVCGKYLSEDEYECYCTEARDCPDCGECWEHCECERDLSIEETGNDE